MRFVILELVICIRVYMLLFVLVDTFTPFFLSFLPSVLCVFIVPN